MTLPIMVLSLPGCAHRLDPLRGQLVQGGIPHEILFGVDARGGLPEEWEPLVDRVAARRRLGREMHEAEFGCALSHRAAWVQIVERDWPGAVILEDDARPLSAFGAFVRAAPPPCGLLQLGYHPPVRVMGKSRLALPAGGEALELAHPTIGAFGYWVSRAAADSLVRAATPIRYVADWPCDVTRLGAFVTVPRLVAHAELVSVIGDGRDPHEQGIKSPKQRISRVLAPDYWRRQWRKLGSRWVDVHFAPSTDIASPQAPIETVQEGQARGNLQ